MSRILVLGCGELAWGRPSTSSLFGRQWNRGRLSPTIGFGPDGPIPGEESGQDWVTLAEELDGRMAWLPSKELGPAPPSLTILKGEAATAPLLPTWPELALSQARWATRELGGAGVLITPKDWLELPAGRQLLEAWTLEGWSGVALEEALGKRYPASARCVSSCGLWVRVMQSEEGCVFANGSEAAHALELVPAILDLALQQTDPDLAARWRREESPESGWYVRQRIARKIAKALRDGRPTVDLTERSPFQLSSEGKMVIGAKGTSGALFRFSSLEAQERYQALSTLRITVELPSLAVSWWEQVSQPGFLRSSDGASHPGILWGDRKTVLLEGMEIRKLSSYLTLRNLPQEEMDPSRLEEALEMGSFLKVQSKDAAPKEPVEVSAPREGRPATSAPAHPAEPAAAQGSSPQTAERGPVLPQPEGSEKKEETEKVTALPAFLPQQLSLEVPHRPDRVQVWLDGRRVESGNVHHSARQGLYTIEGVAVPHGAVVRVDFEPPQE